MKLKIYTTDTMPSVRNSGTPRLSINSKSGVFSLSKTLAEQLCLEQGSKVAMLEDEETGDWYIRKAKDDENGFEIRKTENTICFNNSTLARTILTSISPSIKSSFLRVSTELNEEAEAYYILTKQPIKSTLL